jgi:hypothetical protein
MVTLHLIPSDIAETYEVHEWRNAAGVLSTAHPTEWQDVIDVLRAFEPTCRERWTPALNSPVRPDRRTKSGKKKGSQKLIGRLERPHQRLFQQHRPIAELPWITANDAFGEDAAGIRQFAPLKAADDLQLIGLRNKR